MKILIFNFVCDEPVKGSPDKLRGFFAENFGRYTLIHQHLSDNRFLYKAPLIQYKMLNGRPFVIGINEGSEVLQKIYEEISYLRIGSSEYQIKEKHIVLKTDYYGITTSDKPYRFLTPWLALNERNFERYRKAKNWTERREILQKCLIANLISMSKGLGYTVPAPIKVELGRMREINTSLKGVPFLGFLGDFKVNFHIPDLWGIGKSVSRGFGTVREK